MTAPVRIDAAAWGDLRFATLARLCGLADAEHALIKCARIWSWQTEHYTPDQPTYVIDPEIVESVLGDGGAAAMVRARLAEEGPDGLRIRGAEGRIEWLWKSRNNSARGGEATKRKHENKEGPRGLPPARPETRPETQPQTGPLSLSPDPDLPEIHTHARARHPAAGGIAKRTWDYGAKVRAELSAANVQVPPWALTVGSEHSGWVALLDRICELLVDSTAEQAEQVCRNRIDVAAAKARADGDGQWFASTSLFTRKSFDTWAQLDPKQFARNQSGKRAQPAYGASKPRTEHPEQPALRPASEVL
jgi:hypothetical protein